MERMTGVLHGGGLLSVFLAPTSFDFHWGSTDRVQHAEVASFYCCHSMEF